MREQKLAGVNIMKWLMMAVLVAAALILLRPAEVHAEAEEADLALDNQWVTTSLSPEDTVRYFQIEVPSDGWIYVDVQDCGFYDKVDGWLGDCYFRVINEDKTNIDDPFYKDEVTNATTVAPLTMSTPDGGLALRKGTYYIRISHSYSDLSGYHTGISKIRVRASFKAADNDDTGINNSFETATELAAGKKLTGFLACSESNDFYKINVPVATTIEVTLNSSVKFSYFSFWNSDLELAADENEVWYGSAAEPKLMKESYNVAAGVYYLKVRGYDSTEVAERTGKYTLSWNLKNNFTDVSDQSYCYEPVSWAVANGVTTGTSATTFGPNDTCTRAQMVTFLWNAAGKPEPSSTQNPFTDVKSGSYYKAILWASQNGIVSGTSDTTFSPNEKVTRAQAVTILWREAGKPSASGSMAFRDCATDQYYSTAVLWAVSKNVTSGTSSTTFSPNGICTRAQIVTFLYRYAN